MIARLFVKDGQPIWFVWIINIARLITFFCWGVLLIIYPTTFFLPEKWLFISGFSRLIRQFILQYRTIGFLILGILGIFLIMDYIMSFFKKSFVTTLLRKRGWLTILYTSSLFFIWIPYSLLTIALYRLAPMSYILLFLIMMWIVKELESIHHNGEERF